MTRRVGTALALNWTAGYVDAVGFISLYQVYLGNMTGNTVAIAEGLIYHRFELVLKRGLAIPEFIIGLLVSRILVELLAQRGVLRVGAIVYTLEILALLGVVLLGRSIGMFPVPTDSIDLYILIGFGAFAMGLQNATSTHFGTFDIRTTHVTGTISKFADHFAKYIKFRFSAVGVNAAMQRTQEAQKAVVYISMWFFYLAGGIAGLLLLGPWKFEAFYVPIAVLAVIALLDACRPMPAVAVS